MAILSTHVFIDQLLHILTAHTLMWLHVNCEILRAIHVCSPCVATHGMHLNCG